MPKYENWKCQIRYALGDGARPELIQDGKAYLDNRIVERLVPANETFIKGDRRYYRLVIGHGEWLDIPCTASSSS